VPRRSTFEVSVLTTKATKPVICKYGPTGLIVMAARRAISVLCAHYAQRSDILVSAKNRQRVRYAEIPRLRTMRVTTSAYIRKPIKQGISGPRSVVEGVGSPRKPAVDHLA
jgi:hypothetical protein